MKAIDTRVIGQHSQASWFQSAGAGALGLCLGFLLGTTLTYAPREAMQPRIAQTSPTPGGVSQTIAAQAAAAFAAAMPAPAATAVEPGPAPAESASLQPCWLEVLELVRC